MLDIKLFRHNGFDLLDRSRNVGREVDASLVCDEDVVFNADSDALVLNVKTGLDGYDRSGLKSLFDSLTGFWSESLTILFLIHCSGEMLS